MAETETATTAATEPAETAATESTANGEASAGTTDTDIEAIAAKAENPDAVRNALQSERQAAKDAREQAEQLAAKVKEFEDRDKSEQEKLEERATTAEKRAVDVEAKLLRFEVATEKQLPAALAARLQGDTKKELEEDADRLLELVKPNGKPSGDADAGKGAPAAGGTFNDVLRQQVRR